MSGLLGLLGGCLLLGALARRSARFPAQTPAALNAFVLNVALPALVLRVVHGLQVSPALLAAAAAAPSCAPRARRPERGRHWRDRQP